MLKSFTRNYQDDSTDAGFQFTFYCDVCGDGYKSTFIESKTYKQSQGLRGISKGLDVFGQFVGGRLGNVGYSLERGASMLSERFDGMSPDWQREHEEAFFAAQEEAQAHFHRCQGCNHYVCDTCFNEEAGLCTDCAPRQDVYVAQARADAMRRNIDEAGSEATVWTGTIEEKATICPACGKPAGSGKFCSHCGASMALPKCQNCGAPVSSTLKFCPECGAKLAGGAPGLCPQCGTQNDPGTKFCGECGNKL